MPVTKQETKKEFSKEDFISVLVPDLPIPAKLDFAKSEDADVNQAQVEAIQAIFESVGLETQVVWRERKEVADVEEANAFLANLKKKLGK